MICNVWDQSRIEDMHKVVFTDRREYLMSNLGRNPARTMTGPVGFLNSQRPVQVSKVLF